LTRNGGGARIDDGRHKVPSFSHRLGVRIIWHGGKLGWSDRNNDANAAAGGDIAERLPQRHG